MDLQKQAMTIKSIEMLNIGLCSMAVIIILIVLLSYIIHRKQDLILKDNNFRNVVIFALVGVIAESLSWNENVLSQMPGVYLLILDIDYIAMSFAIMYFHLIILDHMVASRVRIKWYSGISFFILMLVCILWLISNWTGLFFTLDNGLFIRSNLYNLSQIPEILIFVFDIFVIILNIKKMPKMEFAVWIGYMVFTLFSVMLTLVSEIVFMDVACSVIILLMYLMLSMQSSIIRARQQTKIEQQKNYIALSQMEPHFLYNTISAIMGIEGTNSETRNALVTFGKYLRQNLDSIKTEDCIPFTKELEHVKLYSSLETLRFDDVKVIFEVEDEDFLLPPLVVQILVENAIRHGVSVKECGGSVRVTQSQTETDYMICVEDDGIGFEPDKLPADNKTHVGLENIELRLKEMCGGKLILESKLGVGTKATIIIPKIRGKYN